MQEDLNLCETLFWGLVIEIIQDQLLTDGNFDFPLES